MGIVNLHNSFMVWGSKHPGCYIILRLSFLGIVLRAILFQVVFNEDKNYDHLF